MKRLPILVVLAAFVLLVSVVVVRLTGDESVAAQSIEPNDAAAMAAEGLRVRNEIQNDPVAPTIAPAGYDVTIVMFSDYQCPYCRKVHPVVESLMASDKKVKLVYRDWPIFGAPSTEAARAAIASKWQGKHASFHGALMKMPGKVSSETIRAAADKAGVNWTKLQSDLVAHKDEIDGALSRSSRQAAMLGLQGTPGFLIGPYLIPGGIDLAGLRKAVDLARTAPNGQPAA